MQCVRSHIQNLHLKRSVVCSPDGGEPTIRGIQNPIDPRVVAGRPVCVRVVVFLLCVC